MQNTHSFDTHTADNFPSWSRTPGADQSLCEVLEFSQKALIRRWRSEQELRLIAQLLDVLLAPRRSPHTLHIKCAYSCFDCVDVSQTSTGYEPRARNNVPAQWSDSACRGDNLAQAHIQNSLGNSAVPDVSKNRRCILPNRRQVNPQQWRKCPLGGELRRILCFSEFMHTFC